MPLTLEQLPDDIAELKRLLLAKNAELIAKDTELAASVAELAAAKNGLVVTQLTIEKLKAQIAKFKREKFGSSSERIERVLEQLELALEEAETAKAEALAAQPQQPEADATDAEASVPEKKKRRQFSVDLPRRDVVHGTTGVCKTCGGNDLRTVSESITEVLSYVPARFEVIRHVRPACSCRKCETMVQAPMPELPIPRGMVDASFLAHMIVAKFCDHIPLYRQAEIDARVGVEIDRSQRAEWLGHMAWLLSPLVELTAAQVMAGRVIHADDTPVDVLAPGTGKTKTGRFWVYLRDERNHAGTAPPAVLYRYTPDRKGEHCRKELTNFTGWLHADGYTGFGRLYEIAGMKAADAALVHGPPRVAEVGCWSHVRRGFFDEYTEHKGAIAKEALDRIGALFDIERPIAGSPPDIRRAVRQRTARPKIDELAIWLDAQLGKIPGKSELAKAIRYARSRWPALTRYLDDGRLEISNNAAENKIRPAALGRKNSHDRCQDDSRNRIIAARRGQADSIRHGRAGARASGFKRRSIKLSFGDLAPHDDHASEGCLYLAARTTGAFSNSCPRVPSPVARCPDRCPTFNHRRSNGPGRGAPIAQANRPVAGRSLDLSID